MTLAIWQTDEGYGHPHVLIVHDVTLPDGPLDDGSLGEYDLEHPSSCKEEQVGEGEYTYTHYVCDVAYQEENTGLAFSLRYSGTPITEPGRYRIQGWWNRSPSGPWGPAEYDAGVGVMEDRALATLSTEQWELHQQATDHTVVVPDDGEPAFCTVCEWIEER